MSIIVKEVSKIYGTQKALNSVSFSIESGEIVGFLGPNGAGKSTMMKIITCFIPQTEGNVNVCGLDVTNQSIEVKAKVGYLPENNPLYTDMYVAEYLAFVAGTYGMGKSRVEEMIEKTGLTPERHKKIGQLSKGYRQRVGLAAALIHDPEVLILDEPTTGLDPNQLVEIRNLIKAIGKEKTVMLSTHIMQEVEQLCDRVIIINKGEIVADESIANITRSQNKKVVLVEFDKPTSVAALKNVPSAGKIKTLTNQRYEIETNNSTTLRQELFAFAVNQKMTISEISEKAQNLEKVFQTLTGKK